MVQAVLLTHELPDEIHPSVARHPIAKLNSCRREFHKEREEAMEGRGSFQVRHPSSPLWRLANRACKIVPMLRKCTVREGELARSVKWTQEGWSMGRVEPILAALSVLRPKLVE